MEKAYPGFDWEDRPSTATPLDEQNLDPISRGLSLVDDRVIDLYNAQQGSSKTITVDETTGLITVTNHDGTTYSYNPSSRIYTTIANNQQATQNGFAQVNSNFGDVHDLLDAMDLKVDLNAATANAGLTNLQTQITQNDGYYRQEMSGISADLTSSVTGLNDRIDASNNDLTLFKSSITQTTQAIQLSVSSVSGTVDELSDSLDSNVARLESEITVTAGAIAMKVSKLEVIDDLQQEFGSGIEITPDRITFGSTGAMVVNTTNFKLNEDGDAEFAGHVDMASGSVGGKNLATSDEDDKTLAVLHSKHAWKLQTSKVDNEGTRYYPFMTKNKIFIVNNEETAGHHSYNDVTVNCSIGSKNYPWRKGYFTKLFIEDKKPNGKYDKYSVIPEGIDIELPAADWVAYNGYYTQEVQCNNMSGNVYVYIATSSAAALDIVYRYGIDVDNVEDDSVTFVAKSLPASDVTITLLAEEYRPARIDPAVLTMIFNSNANQASCWWSSPDGGRFMTWASDELVVERYDETLGDWVEDAVFPLEGEDPFGEDQFEDDALIIGSEGWNG